MVVVLFLLHELIVSCLMGMNLKACVHIHMTIFTLRRYAINNNNRNIQAFFETIIFSSSRGGYFGL